MAYTWGTIQTESLKKMFLNNKQIYEENLEDMRNDNKYKIYLNAMPQAANEAIAEVMKRSRPYIKTVNFTQFPVRNLLGENYKTFAFDGIPANFRGTGALSYYFEVDNKATIVISRLDDGVWTVLDTINNKPTVPGKYTAYKGFIENLTGAEIEIEFQGENPYHFRNVALYPDNYDYNDKQSIKYIPDFKPYYIYNLKSLADDFYKVIKLYHEDEAHELINRNDFVMEDAYTMVLNKNLRGNFILKYQPYQETITLETPDDTEIQLEEEIAAILPLYIASQLYKDDDIAISTMYRNEFEVALEDKYPTYNDLKFVNKSRWL